MKKRIEKAFSDFEIEITEDQIYKFVKYYEFLLEENSKYNLTSIEDEEEYVIKHILDSVLILKYVEIPLNSSVADIGIGAGFPSIPVKIMRPDIKITGIDSLDKRIGFLCELAEILEFDECIFVHGRSEICGKDEDYRESFDFVLSRAVAELRILNEFCLPFVKKGGKFVALKGKNCEREINDAKNSFDVLKSKIVDSFAYVLPLAYGDRNILLIEKYDDIPAKYPRKAGIPKKRPL